MKTPHIDFNKNKVTFALGLLLQHITLVPLITSYLAYKNPKRAEQYYYLGGMINVTLIAAALTIGITFLYKYAKLNLWAAISLPIISLALSLILGFIGFAWGECKIKELSEQYKKNILNDQQKQDILWLDKQYNKLTEKGSGKKIEMIINYSNDDPYFQIDKNCQNSIFSDSTKKNIWWENIQSSELNVCGCNEMDRMVERDIILHATLVNFFPVLFLGLLINQVINVSSYLCTALAEKVVGRESSIN